MTKAKLNKKNSFLDEYHQSKWMRYEDDIIRYYHSRITEWQKSRPRQWSITAFTSGIARWIAGLIEAEEKVEISGGIKE